MIFIIIGFFLRLYLGSLAQSKLIWDMEAYSEQAKAFLAGRWPIDCCLRNEGYSAFLAIIYFIFGIENLGAVRLVNILFDLITACLVYIVGKDVFNQKIGLWGFILFILNPLTSSYTGLVLAESISVFYIVVLGFIITRKNFRKNLILWFLSGIVLGLLLFTKHAFYYFSVGTIFILALFLFKGFARVKYAAVAILGLLIVSSYSIWGYYRDFKIISLAPPYPMTNGIIYADFYLGRYPEIVKSSVASEYTNMALDFAATPVSEKNKFSQKYSNLFWQKMRGDWPVFLGNYFRNMVWMWDKEHLYTYNDPFYPTDKWPIRVTNIIILTLFGYGVIKAVFKKRKTSLKEPFILYTAFLFLYMTILFPLVTNETRHTLPFYPLAFIWVSASIIY